MGQAELYIEASGKEGRAAVISLALRFSGAASKWFQGVHPSPSSPASLFEVMNIRFRGSSKAIPPAAKFYKALTVGKDHNQSWEEYVLELQDLARMAEIDEEVAFESIRSQCHLDDKKTMATISGWNALLGLARHNDTKPKTFCRNCKASGHYASECKKKEEDPHKAGPKPSFFTESNKSAQSLYSAARTDITIVGPVSEGFLTPHPPGSIIIFPHTPGVTLRPHPPRTSPSWHFITHLQSGIVPLLAGGASPIYRVDFPIS